MVNVDPKELAKFLGLKDKYFYEDSMSPELEEKFKKAKEKQRTGKPPPWLPP